MAKLTLPRLRAHYAQMAAQSRRDADTAAAQGSTDIAAIHTGVADKAQAKANAITVALRAQHMARAA